MLVPEHDMMYWLLSHHLDVLRFDLNGTYPLVPLSLHALALYALISIALLVPYHCMRSAAIALSAALLMRCDAVL